MPVPSTTQELIPGDVAVGQAGDRFKTLLGSCICVVLTDPRRTVAAMCHIVHVGRAQTANQDNTAFGEAAMRKMFMLLTGQGVIPRLCEAFVYGGGNMFPQWNEGGGHVGESNSNWVLRYLDEHGISVIQKAVGGASYRKVFYEVGQKEPVVETIFLEEVNAHVD